MLHNEEAHHDVSEGWSQDELYSSHDKIFVEETKSATYRMKHRLSAFSCKTKNMAHRNEFPTSCV